MAFLLNGAIVVDQKHFWHNECHQRVLLFTATAVQYDTMSFEHHPSMMAANDCGAARAELWGCVHHNFSAEQRFGMGIASIALLQACQLGLAIFRVIGLEASMHENETAEQWILLDVHPWT
jgi:hypothetical protein